MKIKDARELNEQELEVKIKELKEELFNLRFQQATGQLENYMRIKEVRHSIARVKTVLRERALS
ncbi:MAG: 50S ribosomal protein L29 [Clostridia bacterium]|nr:50S ribosomal protein L29 [Clostridia bacterium]